MKYIALYRWEIYSFIAGVLLALSFSPFDYWFFTYIGLALIFASWLDVTPRRAALRGYVCGLGLFGVGVSWVFVSLYSFGGAHIIVSCLLTALFCGFWALFPALTAYLCNRIDFSGNVKNWVLLYPTVWILIEYLRGDWVLNGFPWFQMAYSQIDAPLSGFLPVIGVYGTGFLTALSATIFISLLQDRQHSIRLLGVLLGIFSLGIYLKTIDWTHVTGKPITVSLIQGNISQDKKWHPDYKSKTLALYKRLTEQHWTSRIIIWPETSIPAFLHQVDEDFLQPLQRGAEKHNTDLVVSLPVKDLENGQYFNSVMVLGKQRAIYRKIHLLPFGEYLPLQPVSGYILDSLKIMPTGSFTAGQTDQELLQAGGYSFIPTICYEDAFGVFDAEKLSGAAYLVNVTNDGWFSKSLEPYQHMQIARMRAIEAGRYLIRATNTGLTAIVGPRGQMLDQAPLYKVTVLTGEIVPMAGITPITWIGNWNIIIIIVLGLIFSIFLCRMSTNKKGMLLSASQVKVR